MEKITVDLNDDKFIHFTYDDRAKEILKSGKLLVDSPYKQVGLAGVQAVSVKHGMFIPGVQVTRLIDKKKPDQTIVAVLFKTNTRPKYGYPEEVIWEEDVRLINPEIIDLEAAKMLLSPRTDDTDYMLIYESLLSHLLK